MTTEYLSVRPKTIVKDIFEKIKEIGNKLETVRTIFITDSNNKLVGTMSLEKMMFEDEESKIEDIMNKDFAYISPNADKEEAIPICRNYDLAVLPVMSKTGELLGIITFDDVMDVIEEANTEDVLKQAGVTPSGKPYAQTKAFRMALSYVMWLIILLVINTFTSIIISNFEHALLTLPVLISFLPALNDTGGNSGDQTTSIITRSLATGEITVKDYFKVAGKELLVGFLTALIIAAFNFGWVMVELNAHLVKIDDIGSMSAALGNITTQQSYMVIAGLVSVALFFSVVVSKFLGASLPMLAKLCHIDPAIMSGPLIASIMDILTLLIYFTVSITVINYFSGLAASVTLLI